MAVIKIYDNIFEDSYREVEYDFSRQLIEQIESLNTNEYKSTLVECYDTETGTTYYEPILDNSGEQCVTITVNNVPVDSDYKVKENDVITVAYLPLSERAGYGTAGAVIGAFTGIALGAALGGYAGAALGVAVSIAKASALGGVVGLIAGTLIGLNVYDMSHSSYDTGKDVKKLPDVRGAQNQALTGNAYPFVLGKHLITPFIDGSAHTEYSGKYGEDAYITILGCAGYGPLKLTDFKLGDIYLAYNRTKDIERHTILSGLLKGYSQKDSKSDSGDILDVWANNDISLEIIQQSPNSNSLNRGTIYPTVKKDLEVNSSVLYVADKNLDSAVKVVYKGESFPNTFRSNTVKLTERCPMKFTITLDMPNGLYSSHSEKDEDANKSQIVYEKIPLWLAVQWRVIDVNNKSSQSDGSDNPVSTTLRPSDWHTITTFNNTAFGQRYDIGHIEEDIAAHKGNTFDYDLEKEYGYTHTDEEAYFKSYLNNPKASTLRCYDTSVKLGPEKEIVDIRSIRSSTYYVGTFTNETLNQFSDYTGRPSFLYIPETKTLYYGDAANCSYGELTTTSLKAPMTISVYNYGMVKNLCWDKFSERGRESIEVKNICIAGFHTDKREMSEVHPVAGFWQDTTIANFESWSGLTSDGSEEHLAQMRAYATVDLRNYPGVIDSIMDTKHCPQQAVEVRVIRVSPNYLNQTSGTESSGAYSYSDSVKWLSLSTEIFDEEAYLKDKTIKAKNAVPDEDLKKFCFVALKAKADLSGNIANSLGKFNCIAEAFAPYWDFNLKKWIPENVAKKVKYYGYYLDSTRNVMCNRGRLPNGKLPYEIEVSKALFESARQQGYNWLKQEAGSTYTEQINSKVLNGIVYGDGSSYYFDIGHTDKVNMEGFTATSLGNTEYQLIHNGTTCTLLSQAASMHNNNSVASGFMLGCVGPQNGPVARGYEDINCLSVADLAEFGENVTDGSTYSKDTYVNGQLKLKGTLVNFRFEANAYIYQQQKLEDMLSRIATCGRSTYTYDEVGKIKVIIDKPVPYVKGIISQQNCISGTNTFSYTDDLAGYQIEYPDENDGYEKNNFYCWADGNSLENYKGQVASFSLPYVTNGDQAWSLGRYAMACALMQKTMLTRRIGIEGNDFELGDVVLVQSEELLIGNNSGRIQELILDKNQRVLGFVTDATYEYSDEKDEEGNIKQGITILQPKKFGQSRVVTFRLSAPQTVVSDGVEYTLQNGITNIVLFDENEVININADPTEFGKLSYNFNTGDTVLFGEYSKIGEKYRIIKIKPESDRTFTQTLIPYMDELYNYGAALPVFHPSVTSQPTERDFTSLTEVPRNIFEQNNIQNNLMSQITDLTENFYANHIVNLYKRSTTPLTETGISGVLLYNFAENKLSWEDETGANGWCFTVEEAQSEAEGILYQISATAFGKERIDNIFPEEWTKPFEYGKNGLNVFTIQLFRRVVAEPEKPQVEIRYNFATNKIENLPPEWERSIPPIDDEKSPVYEIHATAMSDTEIAIIDPTRWSNPEKILQDVTITKSEIEDIIKESGFMPTTVVQAFPSFVQFQTTVDGYLPASQSFTTKIEVRESDELLAFDYLKPILPSSDWHYEIDGNSIKIIAPKGEYVRGGSIDIPIEYTQFTDMHCYYDGETTEENTRAVEAPHIYGTGEDPYGTYILMGKKTQYTVQIMFTAIAGGSYKYGVSKVDELPEEQELILDDFIAWTGPVTASNLVVGGKFWTGHIYHWIGGMWEEDSSTTHMAPALNDVLKTTKDVIDTSSTIVDDYLKRVTANDVFTHNLFVDNDAWIKALASKEIVVGDSEGKKSGFIQSSNYVKGSSGWKISSTFDSTGVDKSEAEFNDVKIRGSVTASEFILEDSAKSEFSAAVFNTGAASKEEVTIALGDKADKEALETLSGTVLNKADKKEVEDVSQEMEEKLNNSTVRVITQNPFYRISLDGRNLTPADQSLLVKINVNVGIEENVKYQVRTDLFKSDIFTLTISEEGAVLLVKGGVAVTSGTVKIPVSLINDGNSYFQEPYGYEESLGGGQRIEYNYASSNTPKENEIYANAINVTFDEVYYAEISYEASCGGFYRGTVSTQTALPSNVLLEDFILWTGADQNLTFGTVSEMFYKGCVYKWNGSRWIRDSNTEHYSRAMNDVLSINENELSAIPADAEDKYFNKIVSRKAFFNQLVANEAFIERLTSEQAFITKLGTKTLTIREDGSIRSSNFSTNEGFFLGTVTESDGTRRYGQFIANNAVIRGKVYATDGEFTGKVTATSGSFSGDVVAKSLKLGDTNIINIVQSLDGYATNDDVAKYVNQNAISEVTQAKSDDGSSIVTVKKDGTVTKYKVVDTADYLYFDKDYGTQSPDHKKNYTKISKDGLLTANNALIYGTVYATSGEFTGKVTATDGEFKGVIKQGLRFFIFARLTIRLGQVTLKSDYYNISFDQKVDPTDVAVTFTLPVDLIGSYGIPYILRGEAYEEYGRKYPLTASCFADMAYPILVKDHIVMCSDLTIYFNDNSTDDYRIPYSADLLIMCAGENVRPPFPGELT